MKISVKKTKNGKIKIYADGEERFTVPAAIWYSSRFHDGDDVTDEELSGLKNQGDSSLAFESAVRMISLREHSEAEIRRKLGCKYPQYAVDSAVSRLLEINYINDEKYAVLLAEELYRKKNFAPKRILQELKSRGVDSEIAENAVNALDIDKEIGIIKIIEKYKIDESSSDKDKNRVIRRLLGMGYSFSDISEYIHFYE